MKRKVEFKVVKKNRYGHRFIEEPVERIAFRNKCKYKNREFCDKGYYCYVSEKGHCAMLLGCTPEVYCPRLKRWDKRRGLSLPYTMVENQTEKEKSDKLREKLGL